MNDAKEKDTSPRVSEEDKAHREAAIDAQAKAKARIERQKKVWDALANWRR